MILRQMPKQDVALDLVFHALADPTRRAMVERMARGPATVSELASPFEMALPSLMQHLKVLEESGLVQSEKVGRVRTCRVIPARLARVEAWAAEQRALWAGKLDRLEEYLAELQAKGEW